MSCLIFILVVFIGIPFAITLATPARHLGFYLLWLAMLAVLAIVWPRGADHSRFGRLDEIVEAFFLGVWTSVVVLKVAIVGARRWIRPEITHLAPDESNGFASAMLPALTGLFAAPWGMFLVALAASATSSAILAHGATSIVLISAAALLAKSKDLNNEMLQTFAGALLGSAIITLVMGAICVSGQIVTVVNRAEAAADGHPYCIEIETMSAGSRPAASWLDFSPLMMRARCSQGVCYSRHARLAVGGMEGRGSMYWSYRDRTFQEDGIGASSNSASGSCKPVQDFARHLPLF